MIFCFVFGDGSHWRASSTPPEQGNISLELSRKSEDSEFLENLEEMFPRNSMHTDLISRFQRWLIFVPRTSQPKYMNVFLCFDILLS